MSRRPDRIAASSQKAHPFIVALRARRVRLNLSQRDLAARVGCSAGSIALYEAGSVAPSFATLEAIAQALDMRLRLEAPGPVPS